MNNHNQELRFRRSSGTPESVDWELGLHDEHKHNNDHEDEQKRESAPPLSICQKVILKLKNLPCPSHRQIACAAICGCVVFGGYYGINRYNRAFRASNDRSHRHSVGPKKLLTVRPLLPVTDDQKRRRDWGSDRRPESHTMIGTGWNKHGAFRSFQTPIETREWFIKKTGEVHTFSPFLYYWLSLNRLVSCCICKEQ